ncbi:MAG: hypothetical protein ACREM1_00615 [Longimicrobiales bacterium]
MAPRESCGDEQDADVIVELTPEQIEVAVEDLTFFSSWGGLALGALLVPDALRSARWILVLASALALAVPIAIGIGTGSWPWTSAARQDWTTFSVDVAWLLAGPLLSAVTTWAWPQRSRRQELALRGAQAARGVA